MMESNAMGPGESAGGDRPPPGAVPPDYWVAILAHELRTPLTSVHCAIDVLGQFVAREPEARVTQDALRRSVQQMACIISDVIDFSRSGRGKLTISKELVDVAQVISSAVAAARPTLVQRHHMLDVDLPIGPIVIAAHPARLQQIIVNLLVNATKFTRPRGRISLNVSTTATFLLIKVADNGIGIDPQHLSHIFEPFHQAHSETYSRDGLGLGLALVKMLVHLHGGTVSAYSSGPEQGAEFVVRLPLLHPATQMPEQYLG